MPCSFVAALLMANALGLDPKPEAAGSGRIPATIRVILPADARLTFDGQATQSTGSNRVFVTPPLAMRKNFCYSLECRFVRAGKTITVHQDITIEAGCETQVSLHVAAGARGAAQGGAVHGNVYGIGRETDSYSYGFGPPAPPPAIPSVGPSRPLVHLSGRVASEGGFHPPHYGPDPSDPFYPSYGQ
jgi:uncharacterized protein (TIGR03000 family)